MEYGDISPSVTPRLCPDGFRGAAHTEAYGPQEEHNMSAYIVNDVHVHALLSAGLSHGPRRGILRWQAPESEEPAGEQDYQAGEPWGATSVATATRRSRELTVETADSVGLMLLAQNYASVNFRYESKEDEPLYRFTRLAGYPDPVIVLKALGCYEYQACETPDWEQTEAQAFCQALRKRMIGVLPGYEDAPWEITTDAVFRRP